MKKIAPDIVVLLIALLLSCKTVQITDGIYENRPHFKVKTGTATYYLDKKGGAISRLMDRDGIDWVHYQGDPHATAPSGAAGGFRGIPNLVYRSVDGGAGHPGFDQCISERVDKRSIRSKSISGKWQWVWTFFDDHAELTMEKTDPAHAYWFLYEGPIAGSFDPSQKFWGTNLGGPRYEVPSLNLGEAIISNWHWVYFGDKYQNRSLFLVQLQADTLKDHFAYMGNTKEGNKAADGMVVFGFGRDKNARPLMTESGNRFIIGFLNRKIDSEIDHKWAAREIGKKSAIPKRK